MHAVIGSLLSPPGSRDFSATARVGHFFAIDLLRGLAAVAVIVWHYQFFFQAGPLRPTEAPADIDRAIEPLYALLWPLYQQGYWAVQLFWMISGFVFAHVYGSRDTTLPDFAVRRFARLYPLHLITLLVVAALQAASRVLLGGDQIVSRNDPYHFLLQLFMASQWGLQDGVSFNAPVWSVSIEEPVYLLFFLVAMTGIFRWGVAIPAALAIAGAFATHALQSETPRLFAMCILFYFCGVCLYLVAIRLRGQSRLALAIAAGLGATALTLLHVHPRGAHAPAWTIALAAFAALVLLSAALCFQPRFNAAVARIRWLGDATYSIYLWHFPIIVLAGIIMSCLHIGADIFRHPAMLTGWVVLMAGVGTLSFRWIERPLQRKILQHDGMRAFLAGMAPARSRAAATAAAE